MSDDQTPNQNATPFCEDNQQPIIDLDGLKPPTKEDIAEAAVNGYDKRGNVSDGYNANKTKFNAFQRAVADNTQIAIIGAMGLAVEHLNANKALQTLNAELQELIQTRYNATRRNGGTSTLTDFQKSGQLFIEDLYPMAGQTQSRIQMITEKIVNSTTGNNYPKKIRKLLKAMAVLDIRIRTNVSISNPVRVSDGIKTNELKTVLWILYGGTSFVIRPFSEILKKATQVFMVPPSEYDIYRNKKHTQCKDFRKLFRSLTCWSPNGSAFAYFADPKIKTLIRNYTALVAIPDPPPTLKRSKSSKTPSLKRKYNKSPKKSAPTMVKSVSTTVQSFTDNDKSEQSMNIIIDSPQKKRNKCEYVNEGSLAQEKIRQTQCISFENKQILSPKFDWNSPGYFDPKTNTYLTKCHLGANNGDNLTITVTHFDVSQPAIHLTVESEPTEVKCTDIYEMMDENMLKELKIDSIEDNTNNRIRIDVLSRVKPVKSKNEYILCAPEMLTNKLLPPIISYNKGDPYFIVACPVTTKDMYKFKHSLSGSARWQTNSGMKKVLLTHKTETFAEIATRSRTVKILTEQLREKEQWEFLQSLYGNVLPSAPPSADKKTYYDDLLTKQDTLTQMMVQSAKETYDSQMVNKKERLLAGMSINSETYERMLNEHQKYEQTMNIVKSDMPLANAYSRIDKYKCQGCGISVECEDTGNKLGIMLCGACAESTFKCTENPSLYDCDERDMVRGRNLVVDYPDLGVIFCAEIALKFECRLSEMKGEAIEKLQTTSNSDQIFKFVALSFFDSEELTVYPYDMRTTNTWKGAFQNSKVINEIVKHKKSKSKSKSKSKNKSKSKSKSKK